MDDRHRSPESAELEKYRRVFHATPDYVTFSHLETGIFIDVNPGFEKLIGYKREEVIGRSSTSIRLWVNEEDRAAAVELLKASKKVELITTHFRTRSGEVLLVEASMATFDLNGEALLVAVARDITARKRQEEELEQYRHKLEQLVEQRTAELEQAMVRVRDLAIHDELTGVGNRRELKNQLDMERQLFDRAGLPFCIAILDLDCFKSVNDRFGHTVGDEAIMAFASIIQQEMRVTDYLARYGGDEFVILLRGTTAETAVAPLARICEAVADFQWTDIAAGIALTTSIGVAAFHRNETMDDTFRRADRALYDAKLGGRNRVVLATEMK